MNFLTQIVEKSLLIVENNYLKEKILTEINNYDNLINLKIMTKDDFLNHYFYQYNEETIYYLTSKYNLPVSVAKMYLNNLKYALNTNINNFKINYLKELYNDLINQKLLILDDFMDDYLTKINLIVLNKTSFDPFYIQIFDKYQASYYELTYPDLQKDILVYHFKTIEEECSFLFNQISKLIKNKVPKEKIKITNVTSEYEPYLNRFQDFYNISINGLKPKSIYGTILVQELITKIKALEPKEEILKYLDNYKDQDIYYQVFNILNKYYFANDYYQVLDLLKEDFKKATIKPIKYQDAITISPFDANLFNKDDYVFLIGCNLGNIPKTYQDIDYLNDELKQQIGLFTSLDKNKLAKDKTLKYLKNISNLIITYKDCDSYKNYYQANILEELKINYQTTLSINNTSNLYNKIKLTNQLDLMIKYGIKNSETNLLYTTYQDLPYLTYNNKFTYLKDFQLPNLTLSYTSLNNFYHCQFRYYIDNILKLNIYEDTFKIFIGNLFHDVLSKIFNQDFNFQIEFANYLKDKEFSLKEKFYLAILKEELLKIIKIIKYHHKLSGLDKVKLETEIKLKYQDNLTFKGIIDKIMYKEKDNQTYISLIDYKTGLPKTNMTNLIYGIDMQLPVYVYLIKKSNLFLNPKIIGFYFQQIIKDKLSFDNKKSLEQQEKENLKLLGYSIDDEYLVNMFDESYQNSEMIKGMKTTSKGFSYYTKVISEQEIDNLISIVDLKIKEAFKEIKNGQFTINPKIINGENVGCSFCKYQDLCFKNGNDDVYLEALEDLSYLKGEINAKLD